MNQEWCLLVFTRYPESGKVKTRLIPALGADGAANLQRQMAESTLKQVEALQSRFPLSVEIHFAGGSQEHMKAWLGEAFAYRQQEGDDLGERMLSGFARAFARGMSRVVVIGTDCPTLDEKILAKAFQLLQQSEVVLGPAADGGYYLIGLSCLIPELFSNIIWGTGEVLAKTQQIAQSLSLQVSYLPLLYDVDTPEDLEKIRSGLTGF
jgi:rSAM/selenodomain-associated transferase 1